LLESFGRVVGVEEMSRRLVYDVVPELLE